jgi:hypothetical protein
MSGYINAGIQNDDESKQVTADQIVDSIGSSLVAGTVLLFKMAAPPVGWTQDLTINDVGLRVVGSAGGGVGGSIPFSGVFGQATTGAHVLTTTEMPSHAHAGSTFAGAAVSGTFFFGAETYGGSAPYFTASNANTSRNEGAVGGAGGLITWNYTPSGTVAVGAEGGGIGHTHTIGMALQYVDVIVATKG